MSTQIMDSSSGSMKLSALAMAMNTSSFTRSGTPCNSRGVDRSGAEKPGGESTRLHTFEHWGGAPGFLAGGFLPRWLETAPEHPHKSAEQQAVGCKDSPGLARLPPTTVQYRHAKPLCFPVAYATARPTAHLHAHPLGHSLIVLSLHVRLAKHDGGQQAQRKPDLLRPRQHLRGANQAAGNRSEGVHPAALPPGKHHPPVVQPNQQAQSVACCAWQLTMMQSPKQSTPHLAVAQHDTGASR